MLKKVLCCLVFVIVVLFIFLETYKPSLSEHHGKVESRLYLGESDNQPLIVGFGGSEGGNAWDSDFWEPTRSKFLELGYAFLAIGYFGANQTPEDLDRISLNGIHDAITSATESDLIDANRIAIIGGSKGGELVLNLASYFEDIDAVVAITPSHVSFPSLTMMNNSSSWTIDNEEIPFVPMSYSAVPALTSGNFRKAYETILSDEDAVRRALIPIENINGPIMFLSASEDEMWPSAEMSNKAMEHLKKQGFDKHFEHRVIEGNHSAPLEHLNLVFDFLEKHFPVQ